MSETFTRENTITALEEILRFTREQYKKSQQGYYSHGGWVDRVLQSHLKDLLSDNEQLSEDRE